ncbi:helix-turn-helix domain-containing protein [Mesorhizobium amorphae]|uniref:helix-turn-helix domain-containing protein n=1 Tax=Mesorhizobium amorphae TaxID=71433 RepID=UPI0016434935|nr:helix-turn-helix transcriptional regulator [Mesorhizobium amorphae]
MKLAEYLSQEKLTDEAFGALVGMSQSQISRIKRGVSRPSWENLASIERVTGSLVTAADFIPQAPCAPAPEQAA